MRDAFRRARDFMHSEARLLERLLFAVRFEGAPPAAVGRIVSAYQNPDGGLGHALEPDLRCPESQPLFVSFGLRALCDAGVRDPELALGFCRFLERVCDETGMVAPILPSALHSARAPHWGSLWDAGIEPTAQICGFLYYQQVEHPWLERATRTCCERLLDDPPREAHYLSSAARLAEHLPNRKLAGALIDRIGKVLPEAAFFIPMPPVNKYGLTPLHFAPTPDSPLRRLFTDEQIDAHLDELAKRQQEDGGWPVSWEPPGGVSASEWRGVLTLDAVTTLAAYGRIEVPAPAGDA